MANRDIAEKKQLPEIYEYEESTEILIVNSKPESKVVLLGLIPIAMRNYESIIDRLLSYIQLLLL